MRIAIIGAGPIGLSLAYHLKEHEVTLIEKEQEVGGLARPFEFRGKYYDRYYHFIFLNDYHTIALAKKLGVDDKIRWGKPSMGMYWQERIYSFSTPGDLLKFPGLSWKAKFRFSAATLRIMRQNEWQHLETANGEEWWRELYGEEAYNTIWRPLMQKKFREHYNKVNAAWCWNEIHRRGKSRKPWQKERLGYFAGGVKTLLDALQQELLEHKVRINLGSTITKITSENGKVRIATRDGAEVYDKAFVTIPAQVLNNYLSEEYKIMTKQVDYLSIRCAVIITKRRLTQYFWINICDDGPQVLFNEFANLNPEEQNRVYVPYYVPFQSAYYTMSEKDFHKMNMDFLRKVCPDFRDEDVIYYNSFKDPFAQAVFDQQYSEKLLPYVTPMPNLFLTNQSQIYPERSGINESIRFAERLARDLPGGLHEQYYFTSE